MSELRLAVGQPEGLHSLSWRIWSNNGSFYVMSREVHTSWKASAHPPSEKGPDDAFFFGFEGGWLEKNPDAIVPSGTPRIEQYRPRQLGPGVRRFATIRTHAQVLQSGLVTKPDLVTWLIPPKVRESVDIHLLIVKHKEEAFGWCRAHIRPERLCCAIVDKSVLGDLLVVVEYGQKPTPGLAVSGGDDSDSREAAKSSVAVAMAIESIDGSLLLEQIPVGIA